MDKDEDKNKEVDTDDSLPPSDVEDENVDPIEDDPSDNPEEDESIVSSIAAGDIDKAKELIKKMAMDVVVDDLRGE